MGSAIFSRMGLCIGQVNLIGIKIKLKRKPWTTVSASGKKSLKRMGLYPNTRFFTLFGSVADSQKTPSLPFAKRGKFHTHMNYGAYFVLRESALLCGCHEVLVSAFSSEVANKIFAIAMYAIDAQSSVAQGFSDWCFDSQQPPAKPVVCHDVGNRSKRFRFVRKASAGATSPVYLGVSPRSFGVLRNF